MSDPTGAIERFAGGVAFVTNRAGRPGCGCLGPAASPYRRGRVSLRRYAGVRERLDRTGLIRLRCHKRVASGKPYS